MFIWENVYAYDMDFRIHMSRHPERSWGIILQQAWSMRLQDRINKFTNGGGRTNILQQPSLPSSQKKICWDYNSGDCTFGFSCQFEHRCGICGKLGHGAHICRKLKRNSDKKHGHHNQDRDHHKPYYKDNNGKYDKRKQDQTKMQ